MIFLKYCQSRVLISLGARRGGMRHSPQFAFALGHSFTQSAGGRSPVMGSLRLLPEVAPLLAAFFFNLLCGEE